MSLLLLNKKRKSSAIVDPYWDNVVLYLKGDGANNSTNIIDSSSNTKAISRFGDTKISTTQSKYGGSSIYFDGNQDFLQVPDSDDFNLLANDFTIELWMYPVNYNAEDPIITKYNGNNTNYNQFYLGQASEGNIIFNISINGVNAITLLSATRPNATNWTHIAVARNGNTFRMFFNGIKVNENINSDSIYSDDTEVIGIGYRRNSGNTGQNNINMYFDSVRFTNGFCRYTANFNPETDTYLAY